MTSNDPNCGPEAPPQYRCMSRESRYQHSLSVEIIIFFFVLNAKRLLSDLYICTGGKGVMLRT